MMDGIPKRRMSFLDFNSPKAVSFEPTEFYSECFSVDEFIQRKRYSVPLDVLRDDLGSHLKFLRSSLIELINQDYGHFVNLSSNLVGLDGRIQNITAPLSRAQSDLEGLETSLAQTLSVLQAELKQKKSIRLARAHMKFLRLASCSLEYTEKHILEKLSQKVHTNRNFTTLKVACEKVAATKALIGKCKPSPLLVELKQRWESCCQTVLNDLEVLLKAYGNQPGTQNIDDINTIVKSLLFMYSKLECESVVESIFIKDILQPQCEEVLSRKGNIKALLDSLEDFISITPVIRVSQELEQLPWMKNYAFITRGVFPHVFKILNQKFPHIWSPSTPDTFHSNWIRCEVFMGKLEASMPSSVHLTEFRNSEVLKEFMGKWQFNVYFQLRFHTLAVELESVLESLDAPCSGSEYKFDATRVLVKVLHECWDKEKIFIWQLSGRFLKASALLVSRYLTEMRRQVTSNSQVEKARLINASHDVSCVERVFRRLVKEKLADIAKSSSSSFTPSRFQEELEGFVSGFEWEKTKEELEAKLVEVTVVQSTANISSVAEVPRLFRRTNRDVPTKHSEYVNGMLQPLESLQKDMENEDTGKLLDKVVQQVLNRYIAQVQEILTSVQRMEESLKRLKKVKGQNSGASGGGGNGTALSDDDKIRRQIQIDVEYFVSKVRLICPQVDTTSAQVFQKLNS